MSAEKKIRVGITHGDINGIGYEIILKTLSEPMIAELCTPVLYGSSRIATYYRKGMGIEQVPFKLIKGAEDIVTGQNNLIEVLSDDIKVAPGEESKEAGMAAYISLNRAVNDLKNGMIDVLVTAPINKNAIQNENFNFAGHTEYLASEFGDGDKPLMILFNDAIKVALVTTHLPISEVAQAITKERVIEKLQILNDTLRQDFGLTRPRIAVLSLNPHAGENGLLGKEEENIIIPAIKAAEDQKIMCFGPFASDGFFGSEQYKHFDAVLAMYHDQGLAPFKTIAMQSGVNFTAGLKYIRTSPDHGTGFDIAGKNEASEESLREAIYKAIDLYRNRVRSQEAYSNPLRKQYYDKSNDNVVLDLTKDDDDNE
ncbi:MAG: 4-hydroxythreonine-4-phosphate dehydrogenase PdxA [Muribaculaceae bacterium]|nr:4-hydroxythreonine-4-phosphate dehydrogenase PdxA [Muribaculaceae bacterium]